ncbi:alkaline phosphatase D family protein [Niveispirillum irakense]|uniref:alkaline phosphatase D family protein n=1 Tax=Niveispirillum irakense TaxID=34011 RepID=UPI0004187C34|nr:alkaline phosphatase D family protein [Niveispirillum irakense]
MFDNLKTSTDLNRRSFLERMLAAGAIVATTATTGFIPATAIAAAGRGRFHFPQGLASADPQPGGIMLWTRVEARERQTPDQVRLTLQMAETPDFTRVVVERSLSANADRDHTVRVLVDGLKPDWTYHYRFIAEDGSVGTLTGRTRTAPLPNADRRVKLAFVSCQNFEDGFYGAYRTLIRQDEKAAPGDRIDFVLHLGDQIYETVGYGNAKRALPALPSGGGDTKWGAARHALNLADFRQLYRAYLSDPDYREARARFPFVSIWDDHEFVNDYWQTIVTFTPEGRSLPSGKLAANQAWFEYIPALLTGTPGMEGVAPAAKDFAPAEIIDIDARNAPVDDASLLQEPNNLAAIGSMTIYRSLRFGRHVDLVLTDTRSYRSDHAIPDELAMAMTGQATYMLPQSLVALMDAGRTANGGNPPAMIPLGDKQIPNPRKDHPAGTLLGPTQKEWLKQTLTVSNATWKLLATSVPFLPMRLDMGAIDPKATTLVLTADAWDGFPAERRELMTYLRDRGVGNVVSLSGDHHQSFAGLINDDYDAPSPTPVAVEFSVTGISSTPVFRSFAGYLKPDSPLRPLVAADGDRFGKPGEMLPAFNLTLRHGTRAAMALAKSGDIATALAADNPQQNRHLRYVDTDSNGYGLLTADGNGLVAELVTVETAKHQYGKDGAPIRRTARFTVAPWGRHAKPAMAEPEITGEKPFPLV